MIKQQDALEFLKDQTDYSADLIYQDPPYALGSEIVIRSDGKVDYKKASDFMSKWDMPTGEFWEDYFKEALRTLKYGGHCIMFGMDRQTLIFKYYAALAGFIEKQSLYWFYICLSSDSEIFTNNGWQNIDTIKGTDKVAEFNLETESVNFSEPKKIYRYDFDGELVQITNQETEQLVTPNHKCVILEEGKLKFKYAYELIGKETEFAILNRQEVWKLQTMGKLQTVRKKVCCWDSATKEAVLQLELFQSLFIKNKKRKTATQQGRKSRCGLCCMWQRVLEVAQRYKRGTRKYLLSAMHSQITENERDKKEDWAEKQRQEAVGGRERDEKKKSGSWLKTSLLEGRYNLQKTKGQLLWCKVCSLSERVFTYGTKRRLCYGTSLSSSPGFQALRKDRGSASYQSQSLGQPIRELNIVQKQSRPQEVRSRIRYKTSMAIPTTKEYKGQVWCVETSTGAFIARRNGKVFITGNSNFPKATDLAKGITAQQRVGKGSPQGLRQVRQRDSYQPTGQKDYRKGRCFSNEIENDDRETELTPLAQKYSGYKYSIAPLKQTNETIMIFQKPYKTGSALHDVLAMEKGDKEITCGALNIENSRVATKDTYNYVNGAGGNTFSVGKKPDGTRTTPVKMPEAGRYPAQTYVNEKASQRLDEMSGDKCGQQGAVNGTEPSFNKDVRLYGDYTGYGKKSKPRNDPGGCSKVLHKCDFERGEHDLYFYCPKVSKKERNAGGVANNYHPTVKPISLNHRILSLFKTPNEQRILIPFAGSGSEIIGAIKAGYTNWDACEINADYVKIAEARIKYWSNKFQEDNKQAKLI